RVAAGTRSGVVCSQENVSWVTGGGASRVLGQRKAAHQASARRWAGAGVGWEVAWVAAWMEVAWVVTRDEVPWVAAKVKVIWPRRSCSLRLRRAAATVLSSPITGVNAASGIPWASRAGVAPRRLSPHWIW